MFPYNARLEGSASPGTLDHAIFQFPNTAAASWWKDADLSGNTTSIYRNTALGCWACSGQGGQPSASGYVLGLMGCCWGDLVGSPPTSAPNEPGEIIWRSCRLSLKDCTRLFAFLTWKGFTELEVKEVTKLFSAAWRETQSTELRFNESRV